MDYTDYNDNQLLKAFEGGDHRARDLLLKKYIELGIAYCIGRFRISRHDASDLVQKTIIKINDKIEKRKGMPIEDFKSFFFQSLRNNFSTSYKKKKREKEGMEGYAPSSAINEHNEFITRDLIKNIEKQLTDEQQKILDLNLKGFNRKEIADEMNQSEDQVKGKLERTRRKVRIFLNNFLNIIL